MCDIERGGERIEEKSTGVNGEQTYSPFGFLSG